MEMQIFIFTFIIIYLLYFFTIIMRTNSQNKFTKSLEITYLINRYNINIEKLNYKRLMHIIALANSLIISVTFLVTNFINRLIFKLIIGFIILIVLEILVYHMIGKIYQIKERGNKNV